MAKIKEFNRKTLTEFREGFEKAVAAFSKKSGVAISLGGIRFSSASFTAKIEVVLADTSSGMSAQEALGRKSLNLDGFMFGLTENDYGRTFKNWDGEAFKLTGVKSSRPKYPIQGESVKTGKSYKFKKDVIKTLSKVKK